MKSFVSYIGRYGRGRGEAVRRVPRLMTTALALSLSAITLFIVTLLLAFLDPGARSLLATYLGTYFALVLVASASVAVRLRRVSAMAVAFLVYVATHVTYLTSFLTGLIFPRTAGDHP